MRPPLTPWHAFGGGQQRTLRRPYLDAQVLPVAGGAWRWDVQTVDGRSRQRRWSWRDACDARAAVLAGACTTSQAAARLCLTARTLKLRWRALGMPKEPSSIAAAIRVAIESDPGATDQQIAQRLSGEGYVLSRVSVMRTRRAAGIESSFGRRLQAERDEVDEYVRAYPWMSAEDVRGAMRADGWP